MDTLSLAKALFEKPTAPFFESFVLGKIEEIATHFRLPFFRDRAGNLIVGISNPHALARGRRLLLFAHTDHPGFVLKSKDGQNFRGKWLGGAPFSQMKGSSLNLYDPHTGRKVSSGRIQSIETKTYKRTGMKLIVKSDRPVSLQTAFGGFAFSGFRRSGNQIMTRAADDLAGCVMALGALLDNRKTPGKVVGVFTRAEEVGFVGCWSFLKAHKISSGSMAISLEASRTMTGAELGHGPVLRLGDKSTLFDQGPSQHLLEVATAIQKTDRKFLFQRRIMDGGSCEATALSLFGVATTGLAVPLKNYHNMGPHGPAPEIINLKDLDMGRKVCSHAARSIEKWPTISARTRIRLESNFHKLSGNLKSARFR